METEISQLQSEKKNYENVIIQQLKEIEKLNKYISVLKDNYDKSIRKYINEKMERKVVFASNVSYEPKPDVDDRLFLGEVPVEININKSISKYGGERISFYDTTEVKVQESDKQLNEQNYKSRIIRSIMGSSFFRNWSREQEEQKQFMEENGLKSKKVIAKQRDYEKLSDEATPIQKRIYESMEKNANSIKKIMADDRLTNQMKLLLYARFSDARGTEMEQLINMAAEECIDARWFARVIDEAEATDTYENVRDTLRVFSKQSEIKQRMDFARDWRMAHGILLWIMEIKRMFHLCLYQQKKLIILRKLSTIQG